MKKIISLILVLMMLASMSIAVFAAEDKGSITISGISEGNVYEIYKMLDLSLNDGGTAYTYTVNTDWTEFFARSEVQPYININDAGAVTWATTDDNATMATFAKMALEYAEEKELIPVKSSKNPGEFEVTENGGKFSNLDLGYYLVDSTMGALCGLTTTNLNAQIMAKNGAPTIEKQVLEDSTGQWGVDNTADIGQEVQYRVTITVHAGAQNYVLHDTMEDGLTFGEVTEIQYVKPGAGAPGVVDTANYTVKTEDITCDFEVQFAQSFCDSLETNDKIIVFYKATLNEKAKIFEEINENKAWLTFGESDDSNEPHKSNESTVSTKTFFFDIVKTDSEDKLISGAKFRIYDAETDGNEIYVVADGDGYRRAADATEGVEIEVKNGKVTVSGLDNGTYYLQETEAPDGYNILTARQKFIISDKNLKANFNDGIYVTGSGVQVRNNTGTRLPETGALGTLLFTLLGGGTAVGTGVVLVTKKRMSMIEDEE